MADGNEEALAHHPPLPEIDAGDRVRVCIAGFMGWTLDAFDFFLVVMTTTAIAKDLRIPDSDIFLANWATLAARPLGAIVFGLLADRYGRRAPLMINLVFYSIIEVLTGFSNSFAMFITLRFLFGIGMGGEWGVGASLMMEKVPPRFRGLLSGLLQEGYSFGYLLAALAYGLLYPRLHGFLPGFSAWRIMFFIGGIPALLALFVRYGIKESEVWKATKKENWSALFSTIARHWKMLLFIVVLMAAFNSSSHGTQDLFPTFLEKDWHLDPFTRSIVTAIGQVGAILGGVAVGALSDKFGRRKAIVGAFICALACIPLWAFAPHGNLFLLTLGGFLMQFMVQGAWGVIPAHLSELTPDSVRGFLPGFGYQCGALIAGAVPYFQESRAKAWGRPNAMALTCGIVFIAAIVIVLLGRERKGIHFGGEIS